MSKHTPGPWEYGKSKNYEGFYVAPANRLPTLAACEVFNFPGQTEANARLIAAAPEMLEALRGWQTAELMAGSEEEYEQAHEMAFQLAMKALDKAEGRP